MSDNSEAVAALAEAIANVTNDYIAQDALDILVELSAAGYTLVRKDTLDNPEYDGTDAAHPAWWRGSDHATKVLTAEIERLRAALENLVAEAKSPKVVPTLELLAALQDATRALRPAAHRRQQ